MPRILVNDYTSQPDRMTGIAVYTMKMLGALISHGSNEYIIATNRDPQKFPSEIRENTEIVYHDTPLNAAKATISNTIFLSKAYRKFNCSAIYHPQPVSMLCNLHTSAVVVHDLYRVTNPEHFNWKRRFQWNHFVARGIRGAGAVIAVSQATADAVVAAYPHTRDRLSVILEASPIEAADLVDGMATSELPVAAPYALVVANIEKNKNIGLIAESLSLLAAKGKRPQVVLVGRDEIQVLPSIMAKFPGIDLVHLGSVSESMLRTLYMNARVYINASLSEGFCLPILEAQTCGVPVLCSDLPVLHEVAGEAALFINPHDPHSLAQAIETMFYDTDLRARFVQLGHQNVARFSWRKAALETEAVLARLAA